MPTVDYAQAAQREDWLRHPTLGDPSCDSFERIGGSVLSGTPGLEWPVNGSLAVDPVDGAWYLYAGRYPKGYDFLPPPHHMQCGIFRSRDRGTSWESLGPPWPDSSFHFAGVKPEVTHAPDVTVCFADGRWHMAFDWCSADSTWPIIWAPPPAGSDHDSGVGYAWAESPAGPWQRSDTPLWMNSRLRGTPLLGRYRRLYASTLLRRKHDWLLLAIVDSSPERSRALVALTAARPEGPYSEPVAVIHNDDGHFKPMQIEFFPAFTHAGTVYAPATGLALNRNYQAVFAADLEQAHRPEGWRFEQDGSFWHSEDTPAEGLGLWGQTPGCTVYDGDLLAVFPTRDRQSIGHLGVARRPWDKPFRDRLVFSGHEGAAPAPLRWTYDTFDLDAVLIPRGCCRLLWAWTPVVGYGNADNWDPHPQVLSTSQAFECDDAAWRVVTGDGSTRQVIAEGQRPSGPATLRIMRQTDGHTTISLGGTQIWQGALPAGGGCLGLWTDTWSHLEVSRLAITGTRRPATAWYGAAEAFYGAGGTPSEWTMSQHPAFCFGEVLVHRGDGGRVKWNVRASSLTLWAPSGPDGVAYAVELDGRTVATVDVRTPREMPASPVWTSGSIPFAPHTVVLRAVRGPLVVGALEAVVQ
jgi:hypothetical protein